MSERILLLLLCVRIINDYADYEAQQQTLCFYVEMNSATRIRRTWQSFSYKKVFLFCQVAQGKHNFVANFLNNSRFPCSKQHGFPVMQNWVQ